MVPVDPSTALLSVVALIATVAVVAYVLVSAARFLGLASPPPQSPFRRDDHAPVHVPDRADDAVTGSGNGPTRP